MLNFILFKNPFRKPTRCSIQGLVSLTDNDESTGGLVLVPGSHKHFLDLQSTTTETRLWGDFVRVPYKYPLLEEVHPRLIKCKAGDLIVWDSRSIHCNTPALIYKDKTTESELLRIVTYICMSPLSLFKPDEDEYKNIERFRELREKYVRERITCTHCPLELVGAGMYCQQNLLRKKHFYFIIIGKGLYDENKPLKLNAFQHSLIIGTNVEPENGTEEIIF